MRCVKASLERGGVFVDIGANEGFYTILGARLTGAKGTVIAVEPQADELGQVLAERRQALFGSWRPASSLNFDLL